MSKGSQRRPGTIPDSAWDRIFGKPPEFPAVPAGQQPAVGNIRNSVICPKCNADRLREPCRNKESCPMIATAYDQRRFNREGV